MENRNLRGPGDDSASMLRLVHKIRRRMVLPERLFRLLSHKADPYTCPICSYQGPFRDYHPGTGIRRDAQCPRCGSLERHRLQYLAFIDLAKDLDIPATRILHVAPEKFLRDIFSSMQFRSYATADLLMQNVDHKVDICELPFEDGSYDLVYASHVLEHIPDDNRALSEIARILSPGGIALLPVPVVVDRTVEYVSANPLEEFHVRAPGIDYYDRYHRYFDSVEILDSSDYPPCYQLYIQEDRSRFPSRVCPMRTAMAGDRHLDYVPVCRKKKK